MLIYYSMSAELFFSLSKDIIRITSTSFYITIFMSFKNTFSWVPKMEVGGKIERDVVVSFCKVTSILRGKIQINWKNIFQS